VCNVSTVQMIRRYAHFPRPFLRRYSIVTSIPCEVSLVLFCLIAQQAT
jgi:hypothetical protein